MAATQCYRLIKFGGAQRIIFLVDRANLGKQAKNEFDLWHSPYNQRQFTDEYIVQRLDGISLEPRAKVVISTIQRLYSALTGKPSPHTLGFFNQNLVSSYTHEQAMLDKVNVGYDNLDIFWLKDDFLADTENLPKPAVLAAEIVEDLEEALEGFQAVKELLETPDQNQATNNP
jgi:type I site-specific restriction endonuclease